MSKEYSNQYDYSPTESTSSLPVEILTAALHSLPDSVFLFDRHKYLVMANIREKSLQSWQGPAQIGSRCCEMFWRGTESANCVVDRAMATGLRVEFECVIGAGTQTPVLVSVQPLKGAEEVNPTTLGAIVSARDISNLRRAEAEAIAHKSFMASIGDLSPDEIYALDKDRRISWVNNRAEIGFPAMLLGQRFIDFIAPDSRECIDEVLRLALSGHESQAEIRAIRADETTRDVEAHASPLWREGEVDGLLVFLRDITERKRTQELISQSDKLRAVGELAAGVAHNLNNSLTVIKGRAQLLQMQATDKTALKSLSVISDAVEDGSKTLGRILDFARRDSVQEFGPVELGDLITSSVEIARPKWQGKSGIEARIEANEPIYVNGDLAELREVVLNLIFNAVDAMPEGGIMEMGTRIELGTGCFWVADTGCGMPPETAARIFEPFFTTKGSRGTGLGLSASHGIISRHNGEIIAVSEPGEGTRFEVRLPLSDKLSRFVKQDSANGDSVQNRI
jgi:PAS domain S-box-containing protein